MCRDCQKAYDTWYSTKNSAKKNQEAKQWVLNNGDRAKERQKIYNQKRKKAHKEYSLAWYYNSKEKALQSRKESRVKNREKNSATRKIWKQRNRALIRFYRAKRRAAVLKATPAWANLQKIKQFYLNCPKGLQVDHIVPLQGKTVSGLHVENNLQYLTPRENQEKGNKL